jgi:hypothetical protein
MQPSEGHLCLIVRQMSVIEQPLVDSAPRIGSIDQCFVHCAKSTLNDQQEIARSLQPVAVVQQSKSAAMVRGVAYRLVGDGRAVGQEATCASGTIVWENI